jgi:4-hydroxy-L-threonine phosphate dehydrogenase PdxA
MQHQSIPLKCDDLSNTVAITLELAFVAESTSSGGCFRFPVCAKGVPPKNFLIPG